MTHSGSLDAEKVLMNVTKDLKRRKSKSNFGFRPVNTFSPPREPLSDKLVTINQCRQKYSIPVIVSNELELPAFTSLFGGSTADIEFTSSEPEEEQVYYRLKNCLD